MDKDWYITNIRRGKGNRRKFIYADLRDGDGELMISATLDYIVSSIECMTVCSNEVVQLTEKEEAECKRRADEQKRLVVQKEKNRKRQNLRDSAKDAPHCFGCYRDNPDGNLLCLAHSNRQADGKARGMKSLDIKGAIICASCHSFVDGKGYTREVMQEWHRQCHIRTLDWWVNEGYITNEEFQKEYAEATQRMGGAIRLAVQNP